MRLFGKKFKDSDIIEYVESGRRYAREGNFEKAFEIFEEAITMDRSCALAYYGRGSLYAHMGRFEEALSDLNTSIELNPDFGLSYSNRCSVLFNMKLYDEALKDADKVIGMGIEDFNSYFIKGTMLLRAKIYLPAMEMLEKALRINPDNEYSYLQIASLYMELNDYDRAVEYSERALNLNPMLPDAHFTKAKLLYHFDRADEALLSIQKAIELHGSPYSNYLNLRGEIYFSLGSYDKALADQSEALSVKDGSVDISCIYLSRGKAYRELDLYDDALRDFEEALGNDSVSTEVYYNRGRLYAKTREFDKALDDFYMALSLGYINKSCLYFDISAAYLNINKLESALEYVDKSIEIDPKENWKWHNRGIIHGRLGQYADAINDYSEAINRDSHNPDTYLNRGIMYYKCGNDAKAIEDFTITLEICPTEESAYLGRGITYCQDEEHHQEALYDLNAYIIYSIKNDKPLTNIATIANFYSENNKPMTVRLIWDEVKKDPLYDETLGAAGQIYSAMHSIKDLLLWIEYFGLDKVGDRTFEELKAITHYHLGGSVSTYLIFDELVRRHGNLQTMQSAYYYSLSASEAYQSFDRNAGHEDNEINNYYLGQLALLYNDSKSSIGYFTKSKEFIFSRIMLAYLVPDEYEVSGQELPNDIFILDASASVPDNLNCYFHVCECREAIDALDMGINPRYNDPLWQAFELTPGFKNSIREQVRKHEAEKIIAQMQNFFSRQIADEVSLHRKNLTDDVYKALKEIDRDFRNIINDIERMAHDGFDVGNQIGLEIERLDPDIDPKLYSYLIQYYYLKNLISDNEAFMLCCYLSHTLAAKKTSGKIDGPMFAVGVNILSFSNTGIKLFLSLTQIIISIIENLSKEDNNKISEFLSTPDGNRSHYKKFKDNFWKYIDVDNIDVNKFIERRLKDALSCGPSGETHSE